MVGSLQNLDQLYVLVSSAHKITSHDMIYSVESEVKTQITQLTSNFTQTKIMSNTGDLLDVHFQVTV